jgi:hypothetical protein
MRVLQSWYEQQNTLFGAQKNFMMEIEFLASVGDDIARVAFREPYPISAFRSTRPVGDFQYQPLSADLEGILRARGDQYLNVLASGGTFVAYEAGSFFPMGTGSRHALLAGGRVLLDTAKGVEYGHTAALGNDGASLGLKNAFRIHSSAKRYATETLHFEDDEGARANQWMLWPAVVGFSFTAKCWGLVLVAETQPIAFRRDAFDKLVLAPEKKEVIRAAVRFNGMLDAQGSAEDIVAGKGGSTIFLLHGPPGCGKTVTAEAIAEMLEMPLYVVTAGDLGVTAAEVEKKLSEVLRLCSEWNALTLIDEADTFLETRSTQELQRNAIVCAMLRLLEYHQGFLFLTTNRAANIDPAVRSRITVSLRYTALDAAGRAAVWANFVPEVDCAPLARFPLHGRQIKSCVRLAQALGAERKEALSLQMLERAVELVGDFGADSGADLQDEGAVEFFHTSRLAAS